MYAVDVLVSAAELGDLHIYVVGLAPCREGCAGPSVFVLFAE